MGDNEIDQTTVDVIKTILESKNGRAWMERYIVECIGSSHIVIRTEEDGRFNGYIKAYNTPWWTERINIEIKPEDSWFKKWLKRQLM